MRSSALGYGSLAETLVSWEIKDILKSGSSCWMAMTIGSFITWDSHRWGFSFVVARWTLVDSFYYATVVCTTIGYGDLFPKTPAAKLYTIFLALYGIVILGIFLGVVGEAVVDLHNKSIQLRRQKISSTVVQVLGLETEAQSNIETQAILNDTKQELLRKENSIWEDIYTIVILEAPIVGLLLLISTYF